ncbi:MAG: DUF4340 domain-containing protein [Oscillospiraceae bacterium]|nr:DUF4340 domain-containing protein [Oscillospiraceae bacterium]
MSKRTKTLLLALIVLALLVGLFFAVKLFLPQESAEQSSSSSETSTAVKLISMSSDELASVEVSRPEGGYVLRVAGGEASIDGLEGLPLDSDRTSTVLSQATSLTAKELADPSPSSLGIYGLDNPSYSLTVTKTDGSSFTFEFGLASSASYGTYAKLSGSNEVYLIYTSDLSSFAYATEDFISKKIIPDLSDSADFKSISFSGADHETPFVIEKYDFDSDDDATYSYFTYGVTSPSLKPVDAETIFSYVDAILDTTAQSVLAGNYTDQELAQYGLDNPAAQIEVTFSEEYEEDTTFSFSLSFQDGTVYAICNDVPIIYTLAEADWMTLKYADIVHSLFLLPSIYEVSHVTVETAGQSYAFDVSGEKSETVTYNGTAIDQTAFSKFYQLLIGATHDGNYVPDAQPEGDPVLTITFDYRNDSNSDTLRFYDAGTRKLYVEMNGKIEFTMMSSFLEKVQKACEQVINGETPDPDWKV